MTGSLVVTGDDARPAHGAAAVVPASGGPAPAAGAETGTQAPLLAVSGLSVRYGPVHALQDVSLSVRSGELVALAGENGAGKTSLVRCIAGDVVPMAGEIYLGGQRVPPDPGAAARQGVAVVWQDLALCDNLDVAANILLGRESRRLMMSETRFHAATAALLAETAHPAQGHHPQRAVTVRRPTANGRRGPCHGKQAAGAGARTSRPPRWASRKRPRSRS